VTLTATATDAAPDLTPAAAKTPTEASAEDTLAADLTRETSAALRAPALSHAIAADTLLLLRSAATLPRSRLAAMRDDESPLAKKILPEG
jgi:hypothetical protein